ncbi:MAG: GDSL-type esterase/lipase family protein [Vicinamibacterales bacterium]
MSNSPSSADKPRSPMTFRLLATCVAVVTLEAGLQVAAVAAWFLNRPATPVTDQADGTILCVGDSYTFGIGATSAQRSYPGQLEARLRPLGHGWRVVNGGWPGRNSRELVEALDHDLSAARPEIVYVLVGTNDLWTRPPRMDAASDARDSARFRWRWRTGRLLSLMLSAIRSDGITRATSKTPGADPPARKGAPWPPVSNANAPAYRAAHQLYEDAMTLASTGKRDEAVAAVNALQVALERSDSDPDIGVLFLRAAAGAGENDRAMASSRQLAERRPSGAEFSRIVAWESFQRRDLDAARAASARAEELSRALPAAYRAFVLRQQALIAFDADRDAALEAGLEAHLVSADADELRLLFMRDTTRFTPAAVGQALDRITARTAVPPDTRRAILAVLSEAQQPASAVAETLEAHLHLAASRVREAGAQIVFLSYPFQSVANRSARRVARELGAGWIDVETEIENRLQDTPRGTLFVADGHLNDAGYGIVAALVAADAEHRLLNRPAPPPVVARWRFDVRGEGNQASVKEAGDVAGTVSVDIRTVATPALWDVQLRRTNLALERGVEYEVTLRARADRERHIAVGVNDHAFQSIGLFHEVVIGSDWLDIRRTFTANSTDPAAELHLDVGGVAVSVQVADIHLRRVADGKEVLPGEP